MRAPFSYLIAGLALLLVVACEAENEAPQAEEGAEDAGEAPTSGAGPFGEIDEEYDSGAVTINEMRAQAWAEIDQEDCQAGGGEVVEAGMLGMPRCITPYADAGQTCRDSSECEGRCLSYDPPEDSADIGVLTGQCEADDSPFGCYAEVLEGKSQGFLCVD